MSRDIIVWTVEDEYGTTVELHNDGELRVRSYPDDVNIYLTDDQLSGLELAAREIRTR